MLTKADIEKLESAQQAVDLAQQALKELYKAENVLLAELAYNHMENLGNINQKLRRLLTLTTAKN